MKFRLRFLGTFLSLFILLTLTAASCGDSSSIVNKSATSVLISPKPTSLQVGQTLALSALVLPSDATDKSVVWSSSNDSVATINNQGVVTALTVGLVKITAKNSTQASIEDSLSLDIQNPQQVPSVFAVTISPKVEEIEAGTPVTLVATVSGENNPPQTVTWQSSVASIAEIDSTGKLTPKTAGTTTISATSVFDPSKTDSFSLTVGTKFTRGDYNQFSGSLPSWSQFSPVLSDQDKGDESATQFFDDISVGITYGCKSTPYTLTRTPEAIVTLSPDIDAFWVGSLLQGRGYREGIGSLTELPIRQRSPLTLYIDVLGPQISKVVDYPDAAKVQQSISDLILNLQDSKTPLGGSIAFSEKKVHSTEQAALSLGVSAKYMKVKIKTGLEISRKLDQTTLMVQFYQKLFTVTMVRPQTPADFFSNEFTQEKLSEQISLGNLSAENIPVYVSSITYGRVMHYSFTSSAKEEEIRATLNASYRALQNGVSVTLSAEQQKILQEADVRLVTVGGDQNAALNIIKSGDYRAYFAESAPLSTASPISYQIRNLGDGSTALLSETTTYNVKECSVKSVPPKPLEPKPIQVDTEKCTTGGTSSSGRKSCNTPQVSRTLPEGSYFDGKKPTITFLEANGSDYYCIPTFSDYWEVQPGVSAPRTITGYCHARSPHCQGCRGWVRGRFEITAYTRE
jgi:hypothetical protein